MNENYTVTYLFDQQRATLTLHTRYRKALVERLRPYGGVPGGSIFTVRVDELEKALEILKEEYPAWVGNEQDERPHPLDETCKISWSYRVGQYAGSTPQRLGYIGTVQLFTVGTSYARGQGYKYFLHPHIPGYKAEIGPYDHVEDAQYKAESILEGFLERLGAVFLSEPTDE